MIYDKVYICILYIMIYILFLYTYFVLLYLLHFILFLCLFLLIPLLFVTSTTLSVFKFLSNELSHFLLQNKTIFILCLHGQYLVHEPYSSWFSRTTRSSFEILILRLFLLTPTVKISITQVQLVLRNGPPTRTRTESVLLSRNRFSSLF